MKPTLYSVAGQVGSGKSTYARNLAKEKKALLFSLDQWISKLGVEIDTFEEYSEFYPGMNLIIRQMASQALELGLPVVFDFGVNTVGGRKSLTDFAQHHDAVHEVHLLDIPLEICRERIQRRNHTKPEGIFAYELTDQEFDFIAKNYAAPTVSENLRLVSVPHPSLDL